MLMQMPWGSEIALSILLYRGDKKETTQKEFALRESKFFAFTLYSEFLKWTFPSVKSNVSIISLRDVA